VKRCLIVSVRFLDGRYHGLRDNGQSSEWPPSPFRLFQALVAGNARGRGIPATVGAALQWLEALDPPVILAPDSWPGRRQLVYVLNNVSNRTRTPKMVHPTLLNGDRLLQYIWTFDDAQQDAPENASEIVGAARHIRALGWGIDLAIGNGEILNKLPVARVRAAEYRPCAMGVVGGIDLRTPQPGSFQSLFDNYDAVIKRYESPGITALEPSSPCLKTLSHKIVWP
jgi:CRISPR-associated protein Csb2